LSWNHTVRTLMACLCLAQPFGGRTGTERLLVSSTFCVQKRRGIGYFPDWDLHEQNMMLLFRSVILTMPLWPHGAA